MSRVITVLRYPGGKSKYIKKYLDPYFQPVKDKTKRFIDPFVGGGSYPLFIRGHYPYIDVWINDFNYNVYCFWVTLRDDYQRLYTEAMKIKNSYDEKTGEDFFDKISKGLDDLDKEDIFTRALYIYVMNRTSFSGLTEKGYYTPEAWRISFTPSIVNNLLIAGPLLQGVKITNLSYEDVFKDTNKNDYVFLDPPYDIKHFLYGKDGDFHKGFNHLQFKKDVDKLKCNFFITYNDNETLRDYFKDYHLDEAVYKYSMALTKGTGKASKTKIELMIYNYDYHPPVEYTKPNMLSWAPHV